MSKKTDCSRGDADSPDELIARIHNLEASLSFAQNEIDELNGALAAQDKRIEDLERLVVVMAGRIKQGGSQGIENFDPALDRPPHY